LQYFFFFAAYGEKRFITLLAAREKKCVDRRGLFIIEPRSITTGLDPSASMVRIKRNDTPEILDFNIF
jgi:hypothetical protein